MKVNVIGVKQIGNEGWVCFDCYVPIEEIKWHKKIRHTIHRDGKKYIRLEDALCPESHWETPKGWDRYAAYRAVEKLAKQVHAKLVNEAFGVTPSGLFTTMPGFESKEKMLDIPSNVLSEAEKLHNKEYEINRRNTTA